MVDMNGAYTVISKKTDQRMHQYDGIRTAGKADERFFIFGIKAVFF